MKDLDQRIKGHLLVISKNHYSSFMDLDSSLLGSFMEATRASANITGEDVGTKEFNFIINNGSSAGQVVNHLHLHILPRKKGDGFKIYG